MARNEAEPCDPVPTVTDGEMSRIDLIDVEKFTCSPAKKKTKIDTECVIMGEQLTDLEINFEQQMLKEQFHHINKLQSTLLQERYVKTSKEVKNKLQIIFCKERKHWVVATNIKCIDGEVKVYDSLFQYLDQASLKCIEKLLERDNVSPRIMMSQCHKQKGTKDCGVYVIAFDSYCFWPKSQQAELQTRGDESTSS